MRETIQSKLNELLDIETSTEIPDAMLEENKTYFSFTLNENQENSDFDYNQTNLVTVIGYVKRLVKSTEDTLLIVDNANYDIREKLKELNIKTSYQDVSVLDNIRKIKITGVVKYNEINNKLI